ncbi:MAG: c-type cytochrome [Sulfurospirillaceae bacterium]|nr:c-type cytochrome [Sulfurospirillaceae bacterium]
MKRYCLIFATTLASSLFAGGMMMGSGMMNSNTSSSESASSGASRGAIVFKRCASCHGIKANQHAFGVSNIIAGWPKDKIIDSLKSYRAGTKQGDNALAMNLQAKDLSDADIDAVAAYISNLK